MIYAAPQVKVLDQNKADSSLWGVIMTPSSSLSPGDYTWIGDNEVFGGKFEEVRFFNWLEKMKPFRSTCKLIACPDSFDRSTMKGDPVETYHLFQQYRDRISEMGFPVGLVAQTGLEATSIGVWLDWRYNEEDDYTDWLEDDSDLGFWDVCSEYHCLIPWDHFDALFIGGDDTWKLGADVRDYVIKEALARGKWVHMGRVNSDGRIKYCYNLGVNSVDGTRITKAPNQEFRLIDRAMKELAALWKNPMPLFRELLPESV